MLRILDAGSGALFDPSVIGKKPRYGFGMNIPDHISESWDKNTKILLCGSGIRNLFDPGCGLKKFGSGTNIPDPQHCRYQLDLWLTAECHNSIGTVE
jgi:hypothetical protein